MVQSAEDVPTPRQAQRGKSLAEALEVWTSLVNFGIEVNTGLARRIWLCLPSVSLYDITLYIGVLSTSFVIFAYGSPKSCRDDTSLD